MHLAFVSEVTEILKKSNFYEYSESFLEHPISYGFIALGIGFAAGMIFSSAAVLQTGFIILTKNLNDAESAK